MIRLPRWVNPQQPQRRLRKTSQRVMPRMAETPTLTTKTMVCTQMAKVSNHPTVQDWKAGLMMKQRVMNLQWWPI